MGPLGVPMFCKEGGPRLTQGPPCARRPVPVRSGPRKRSQGPLLNDQAVIPSRRDYSGVATTDELELPLFDFDTIVLATDNFSNANKLGQGGFGCVHKAWKLWRESNGLALMDLSIDGEYSTEEVLRCIQVGLLCVQEQADDRLAMSTVVLMLSSENAKLPQPKHPGFSLGRRHLESDSSSSKQDQSCTVNDVTITILEDGR
ncbi:hypothetical protein RJ639_019136 [Escallonia herrerae]|uniref:Uncharacterized protein n=1 Tax=Escallonia herrerae TaxID=1293975 RepID=A0AA89AJP7_9ASTE|nr:hypothetical protein RJ639_019136 [Escallonia herrerae]